MSMFISRIGIKNFKGIQKAEFEFSDSVNLIIGNNGCGKTSVLEAVAVALGGFLAGIDGVNTVHFSNDEIMQIGNLTGDGSYNPKYITPIMVDVDITLNGKKFSFIRQKKSRQASRSTVEPRDICKEANMMAQTDNSVLPLISFQGISRIANQKRDKWNDPFTKGFSRTTGYIDCLDGASTEKMMTSWFRHMDYVAYKKGNKIAEFEIAKKAVSQFMSIMLNKQGLTVDYEKRTDELVYSDGIEVLPLRLLSSGFRSMVGMVLDVAYRMAVLNPDLKERIISETPGVLLIDEIDLHLHPKWQWLIIAALKSTFPKVQIIASTHSPIVIASCKQEKLFTIELKDPFLDKEDEILPNYTVKGWQVSDVLEKIMKTSDRSPDTEKQLERLNFLGQKKLKHNISKKEVVEYYQIIDELRAILPEGDTIVDKVSLLSIKELLKD